MINGIHWADGCIVHQVNLLIPLKHFVYTCVDLHEIPHGDESLQDKAELDAVLNGSDVDVVDVSTSTAFCPLDVYYPDSVLTMGIASCVRDCDSMQANLFGHLLAIYEGRKMNGGRDSTAARIDFGLGQAQSSSVTIENNRGGVHRLPFCNLKSFYAMNDALQADIRDLLLYLNKEINGKRRRYSGCNDDLRSKLVCTLFRNAGWVGPFVGWEYVNLSLRSAEDTLYKHFDSKNDRREGYNHAAIYSFLRSHCDKKYRVVIVMTYRNSMGCAMDNVRNVGACNVAIRGTATRKKKMKL